MDWILLIWRPLLEIIFIWVLIYNLLRFFQGTRAMQVFMGLFIIAIIFNIAKFFGLHTINWVLSKLLAVGVVAILIIFQPELRRGLARLGQNTLKSGLLQKGGTVDELIKACEYLARNKIGALIAIERDIGLKNYIESGILMDAKVSQELLITLFTPNTPTHDGGVIILGDRIASCGALFPLSQNEELSRSYGMRHRAAVGLSEDTDAVCVVVSEETGKISITAQGKLTRGLDSDGLKNVLMNLFQPVDNKRIVRNFFAKNWNFFKEKGNPS